ncbi:MAG: serine/threonine-protein kinase [Candidatus Hydrogenedentota bacterium]
MSEYPKQPSQSELIGYKLQLEMGRGGSGTVYRALNTETGQVVALKRFHTSFFRNKAHAKEMIKTVKRLKKLDHANVVQIYDFITEGNDNVMVLEFIDGPDLKWYLENRPFQLQERLVILAQICNGLGYLHDQKLMHHDLKPANILFTRKGQVKLCDFSLAGGGGILAMFDQGIGEQMTPMFAAPELVRKEKATKLSDMYSLGIMMYIMFTQKVPFEVDNLQKLYACHLSQMPFHPTEVFDVCPQNLGDIIMRLLAKNPKDRFQDCQELRIALADIGQSRI